MSRFKYILSYVLYGKNYSNIFHLMRSKKEEREKKIMHSKKKSLRPSVGSVPNGRLYFVLRTEA